MLHQMLVVRHPTLMSLDLNWVVEEEGERWENLFIDSAVAIKGIQGRSK